MVVLLIYLSTILLQDALADGEVCKGELKTAFEHQSILSAVYLPREFAVDKSLNLLYFTYGHGEDRFAKIDLETREIFEFHGVFSRSQTVNQDTHDVYLARKTGIYKLDYSSNLFQYVGASDKKVNSVFFYNDTLFFTETGTKQLYMLDHGKVVGAGCILKQTLDDHVVVDGNGTIFFTHADMLYSLNDGEEFVVYEKSAGLITRELGTDAYGGVLACTESGVFYVDKNEVTLGQALAIKTKGCMSVATDRDNNIIYSDGNEIFKMLIGLQCVVYENA